MFVVLEGIDGSGKTSVGREAVRRLNTEGRAADFTFEPSDLPTGRFLRQVLSGEIEVEPITQALLFAADREEHLKNVVIPSVETGKVVVCDRYAYASMAYQGAKGLSMDWILDTNHALPHFREPDAVVYLDIDPQTSLSRTHSRQGKDIFESVSYLERVRENYLSLAKEYGFLVVDAGQGFEAVVGEVLEAVQRISD